MTNTESDKSSALQVFVYGMRISIKNAKVARRVIGNVVPMGGRKQKIICRMP
jgi:hypothetical protein